MIKLDFSGVYLNCLDIGLLWRKSSVQNGDLRNIGWTLNAIWKTAISGRLAKSESDNHRYGEQQWLRRQPLESVCLGLNPGRLCNLGFLIREMVMTKNSIYFQAML